MKTVNWTIHKLTGINPPMWAVLPDDGSNGLIIGELDEVQRLYERLGEFLETGEHASEISSLDQRLGAVWLTPREASERFDVPYSSITLACREGQIPHARKDRGEWEFPQRTFLAWAKNRPGRGRSTAMNIMDVIDGSSREIQNALAERYRQHTGEIPRGQLWQPCEMPGCNREPVCLNCFRCSSHCTCF